MSRKRPGQDIREDILAALATLANQRPLVLIQLSEIVKLAGVTKGSFYAHFSSKEEAAAFLAEEEHERLLRNVQERIANLPPSVEMIVAIMFETTHHQLASPTTHAALLLTLELYRAPSRELRGLGKWHRFLAQHVEDARASGDIAADVDPEKLAWHILDSWVGAYVVSDMTCARRDLTERIEFLLRFVLGAVVAPDRLPYFTMYLSRYAARQRAVANACN